MISSRPAGRVVLVLVGVLAGLILPGIATAGVRTTPVGTTGSSASAVIAGYPVWAHFTDPSAGRDYTIHRELQRLIDAAPSGSSIKGAIHSLSIDWIADALLRAQNRGVTVMVVIDGKNENSTDPSVATIKRLTYHKFCQNSSGGTGCISTSADGDMHTKMFTFTATTDPQGVARTNVTWFGSANLSYSSGTDAFNNTVTVYGDTTLMNGFNANFSDMWNRRHFSGNDYYDAGSGRGYYLATAADAYASPEGINQTDTIVNRINDMTPDGNCRLRIGMASVTGGRPGLVNRVKTMRAAGCWVWMVVGGSSADGISMSHAVYDDLLAAGVKIRRKHKVHDKFFLAYGKYGTTYQYKLYTGSQNWTQDALNENDEIFVKMASETGSTHPLYSAYYTHFNSAYNTGVTCSRSNYPCR